MPSSSSPKTTNARKDWRENKPWKRLLHFQSCSVSLESFNLSEICSWGSWKISTSHVSTLQLTITAISSGHPVPPPWKLPKMPFGVDNKWEKGIVCPSPCFTGTESRFSPAACTYHLLVVRVERLLDERELLWAQGFVDRHQLGKLQNKAGESRKLRRETTLCPNELTLTFCFLSWGVW